ncbi:MAG: hypothetical protein ACLP01_16645 [Solirubrobacteraceae bacterium]
MGDILEILGVLVAADETAGEPHTFTLGYGGSGRFIAGHPGWPEDGVAPSHVEVDELADLGYVRVERRDGNGRQFSVTGEGRRAWERRKALLAPRTGTSVDLSWTVARAVLHELYQQYRAQGAPEVGIETMTIVGAADDPASAKAAIRELVGDGYLVVIADDDQGDVPSIVRPTPKTLKVEEGWPGSSAEAVIADLVEALEGKIQTTTDADEKSALTRVREGLLGAARDFVIAYLAGKAQ